MISLTNREIFGLLKENHRAITYDEFFLIFGNSEVRIKKGETSVFSNFGVGNAYYDCRGQKVDVLLGNGSSRDVEVVSYEIF